MSRQQRLALILAATAVAVIAFIALRPSDDSGGEANKTSQPAQTAPADTGQATTPTAEARPQPKVERIRVAGGRPTGGAKSITVDKGERVVITVSSRDTTDEVHLHGYDIEEGLAPGKPAEFSFKADIDGAFEMELHHDKVPVATLKVQP